MKKTNPRETKRQRCAVFQGWLDAWMDGWMDGRMGSHLINQPQLSLPWNF